MRRARGPSGSLRVGYQVAAELGAWEIVIEPKIPRTYAFRAVLLTQHDYWSQQRPLDLVLALGATEWTWRGVEPAHEAGAITLELHALPVISERATIPASY